MGGANAQPGRDSMKLKWEKRGGRDIAGCGGNLFLESFVLVVEDEPGRCGTDETSFEVLLGAVLWERESQLVRGRDACP